MLIATAIAPGLAEADDGAALELAIKAAFLAKFELYIAWPNGAPLAPRFNICVAGDDQFAGLVERAAAGQTVDTQPIAVRSVRIASADDQCRILYVPASDPRAVRQQLAAVAGQPVLSVTDGMPDGAAKGMINFVIAADRVRFEIDNAAAVSSGLSISSKLLSLAVLVRPAR